MKFYRKTIVSSGLAFVSIAVLALELALTGCVGPQATPPQGGTTVAGQTQSPAATSPTTATTTAVAPVTAPAVREVILATTTSTQDTGLLDVLVPMFEKQTGYKVKTIAVGTGAAIAMGQRGEADVLLVHDYTKEIPLMNSGDGINRKLVMHNDFVVAGPANDPAGVIGSKTAVEAFTRIAAAKAIFVSRGDASGTNSAELRLWTKAGISPKGQSWYQETGQGMGATLAVAAEKQGYVFTDNATYYSTQKTTGLKIVFEGDPVLLNVYHVIQVNPAKSDMINGPGGRAFVLFMIDPATQKFIGEFGLDTLGRALFVPDYGKTEAELGVQ